MGQDRRIRLSHPRGGGAHQARDRRAASERRCAVRGEVAHMATFGYGRVSTQDQTTDNQRMEIERAGYSIDYWFADEGVSGAVLAVQRPQFREMLTKIRNGELLVVTKIDRLGRDAVDIQQTVKLLKVLG